MKKVFILACCCVVALSSLAQQQLGQRPRVKSPVINPDGSVTFNFYDPSAQRVSISGDFEEIRNKRLEMTKQENGIWTVTTAPLNPELYSYSLTVDGHTFGISRLYPNMFDYYGLQSAACRMPREIQPNTPNSKLNQDFDGQMARLFASNPKLFWIAIGKADFLMQMNTELRQYLDAHNYKYEYYENDGGHIWRNWRIYLTMFAQKIFK